MTTFTTVQNHMVATDCSPVSMLEILCGWLDIPVINRPNLEEHIVECLERLPGDRVDFEDPRFTPQDRGIILAMIEEEMRDCMKDQALLQANSMTLPELIGYVAPDEDLVRQMMTALKEDDGNFFMELQATQPDDFEDAREFCTRMKLVNFDERLGESVITPDGQAFLGRGAFS